MVNDESQIALLEKETSDPAFWDDTRSAQNQMKTLATLKSRVDQWRGLENQVGVIGELITLAIDEQDDSIQHSVDAEISEIYKKVDSLEFQLVLSGQYDRRNAIVAIHSGAGGVESQDWAQILMRMYLRWVERRGFEGEILDISVGEEAGIKSVVIQVSGDYAYGYMKAERGVHRLVRLSPFDSDHARHTSFALLEVLPEVEEGVDVTINPSDINIEVFRASGAGGQSVQKNSTAVRITHIATGIKVSCQNERSQYQNKTIALRILMARLVELETKAKSNEATKLKGDHISPQWGNQIRSYVLHPYHMVKDHRTDFETSDSSAVLDGDLDGFIEAYLSTTVGKESDSE